MSKKECKEENKQTNNLDSTEIDKRIRVHYCPGASTGPIMLDDER